MAFQYNGVKLSQTQEEFLESIENKPSPFQGINSLKELRSLTGLSVVVTDRQRLRGILANAKSDTEREIKKDNRMLNLAWKDIEDRLGWIEEHLNPEKSRLILGLYSRKLFWFDGDEPKVYLFADNIEAYASKEGYSEEHVFGFVFIHEMMHAYYDAFNSAGFPAKEPLEEAFAEYGMLTFINKTIGPGVFLEEAKASVFSKIEDGPREYGFGFELFAGTSGGDPEMISDYRKISNWIDYPTVKGFPKDYFDYIDKYKKNTDENNASDCIEAVRYILEHEWQEPDASNIIQPGIGRRVTAVSSLKTSAAISSTGSAGSKEGAPGSLSSDRFWIFDLTSRRLVGTTSITARVPLMVTKALLKRIPSLTYSDLNRLFNPVQNHHLPKSINIISLKCDVVKYDKAHPAKTPFIQRFYDNDPIRLTTGDIVLVTNQWSLKKYANDFEDFLFVAQERASFFVYDSWKK
jgi:hypothetical protein